MIKNIFKIFMNEFITIFKDPGTLLIMVGAIFLYSTFYTMPFSRHTLKEVPIGVVDMDNSNMSRALIRDINSNEFVNIASYPVDKAQADEEYQKGQIKGYVLIAPNFEHDLLEGKNSNIGLYADVAYIIIYRQVATGVKMAVSTFSSKVEIGRLMSAGLNKAAAIRTAQPFNFVQIPLFNPAASYQNYIFPMILILVLQQTMLVGAGLLGGTRKELIIRSKRLGYKKVKYCEDSDSPFEIIIGRGFAYSFLYFLYAIIYFYVFPLVSCYNLNYNIITMLCLLIPYLLSISFLGQTLVALFTERESALLIFIVLSVPMIFVPGYIWPKMSMPLWIKFVAWFFPSTNGIDGILRVNQLGGTFVQVQWNILNLIALCILYFVTAYFVTKKLCR